MNLYICVMYIGQLVCTKLISFDYIICSLSTVLDKLFNKYFHTLVSM